MQRSCRRKAFCRHGRSEARGQTPWGVRGSVMVIAANHTGLDLYFISDCMCTTRGLKCHDDPMGCRNCRYTDGWYLFRSFLPAISRVAWGAWHGMRNCPGWRVSHTASVTRRPWQSGLACINCLWFRPSIPLCQCAGESSPQRPVQTHPCSSPDGVDGIRLRMTSKSYLQRHLGPG